jgi:hypothetical protein
MLFAVAEKLILAAGTYPCEWTYRDKWSLAIYGWKDRRDLPARCSMHRVPGWPGLRAPGRLNRTMTL